MVFFDGVPQGEDELTMERVARWLPGYEVEKVLATGKAGVVFRGRQRSLEVPVTIKVLHAGYAQDRRFRRSFQREAKAAAGLRHPNLLHTHDFGEAEGHLYLVAEYVHGKSLARSLRRGKVEPEQAADIMIGVCKGLGYLHNHGAVHGDLKPSNILLTPGLVPKIGDFGLAFGNDERSESADYRAPELEKSGKEPDERCDVFSAGAILCEMLTGESGAAGLRSGKIHRLEDRGLREIVLKAAHPSPARRYESAGDFLAALEGWKHGEAPKRKSHTPGDHSGKKRHSTSEDPEETPHHARKPKISPEAERIAREEHAREAARLGRKLAIIVVLSILVAVMWWILEQKKKDVKAKEERIKQEEQNAPWRQTQPGHPMRR